MQFLLSRDLDPNCRDNFGATPLLEALKGGHDSTVALLAAKGGTVALREAGSELCHAVMGGNAGLLGRLLSAGVDANSADYDLRTPLHIAAAEGFSPMANLLIAHGANVLARDR